MLVMHSINDGKRAGLRFKQNMLRREIVIEFRIDINGRPELFRFSLRFDDLSTVYRVKSKSSDTIELVVTLPTPPRFFRKMDEPETHESKARYWAELDSWYRQTDITHSPEALRDTPVALKKPSPIIDIGMWLLSQPLVFTTLIKRVFRTVDDVSLDVRYVRRTE